MRRSLFVAISLLLAFSGCAAAQERRAVTEDGKSIIVYPDNTWKYAEEPSDVQKASVAMRGKTRAELPRGNYVLWVDESKWRLDKKDGEPGWQTYTHKNGDGYAMAITERVSIPLPTLRKIAIDNARESAPDVKVTFEETRRVNGLEVLCMRMTGTIRGIQFAYYGYYHSNDRGTIQLLTYTAKNLFPEFQHDFTDFLNGLTMK
jgi:hypothetical protein